jgi:hypothetical protein
MRSGTEADPLRRRVTKPLRPDSEAAPPSQLSYKPAPLISRGRGILYINKSRLRGGVDSSLILIRRAYLYKAASIRRRGAAEARVRGKDQAVYREQACFEEEEALRIILVTESMTTV